MDVKGIHCYLLGVNESSMQAPVCLLPVPERGGVSGEREGERSELTFLPLSLSLPMQVQGSTCLHFTAGKRTRGAERVG